MGQTGTETEKFLWYVWAARLRDRLCCPQGPQHYGKLVRSHLGLHESLMALMPWFPWMPNVHCISSAQDA